LVVPTDGALLLAWKSSLQTLHSTQHAGYVVPLIPDARSRGTAAARPSCIVTSCAVQLESNHRRCCQPLLPLAAATRCDGTVRSCAQNAALLPRRKQPHAVLLAQAQLGFASSCRQEENNNCCTVQVNPHTTGTHQAESRDPLVRYSLYIGYSPGNHAKQTNGGSSTFSVGPTQPSDALPARQWVMLMCVQATVTVTSC
jgi:hypothetical protein